MRYVTMASRSFYACLFLLALFASLAATASAQNFYVQGRQLFDECGEAVTLRGVNKMAVWTNQDPTGVTIFPEIKKTGANVVRISWQTDWSGNPNATLANLDAVIQNCRDNQMIPMIELHDATGDWSQLNNLVTFWTRADVVAVLNKHQRYLLINIGNEVGDFSVSDQDYVAGYSAAVSAMRAAGYRVPLVIDAAGFGQEMNYILNNAPALIAADPQHNLIFSLHVWWHYHGANAASDFINAVDAVVAQNIPFIVGEFAGVCQYCDNNDNDSPYQTVMQKSQQAGIGWIAWEWGPGNEYGNPSCPAMNMTTDGQYTNIKAGWARDVAIDSPFSIRNTAVTPSSIANGQCANQPPQPPPPPPPAAATIEVWWPVDATHLSGVVPFKALVKDTPLNSYQMFWQVDGAQLNQMDDSFVDAPHKEAWADVSGWSWNGNGPYVINFVATDLAGNIIAQQSVTVYVDH